MAMKLWHCNSARSLRPLWALEEMGLEYEVEILPFPPRLFQREYLQVNTLGTVPYFVDGDTHMTESVGICQYLVDRYQRFDFGLQPAHREYGAYLNWLHMSDATLTFPQTLVLRYTHFEPPERRQPQVVEDYRRWFLGRMRAVDTAMQRNDFLCAGRFTTADVAVGYALLLATHLGLDAQFSPAIAAYWQRLQQRPRHQHRLRAAVLEHVGVVVGGEQGVHRHRHHAGVQRAQKADHPVAAVVHQQQHALLALDAQRAQARGHTAHPLG